MHLLYVQDLKGVKTSWSYIVPDIGVEQCQASMSFGGTRSMTKKISLKQINITIIKFIVYQHCNLPPSIQRINNQIEIKPSIVFFYYSNLPNQSPSPPVSLIPLPISFTIVSIQAGGNGFTL